jgi:DnaJ-class molecular chaperone
MRSPYEVLGVSRIATIEEIKKSYRKLSKECHPDTGGDEDQWAELKEAYDCLIDPESRAHFDATGQYKTNAPDKTQERILVIVISAMHEAVMRTGARATQIDLIQVMMGLIKSKKDQIDNDEINNETLITNLKKLTGRFSSKEGPNILDDIIRSNLAQAEQNREQFAVARESMDKAIEMVKSYTYKFDQIMMLQNTMYNNQAGFTWST